MKPFTLLTIMNMITCSFFQSNLDIKQLRHELKNERKMTASELLNWIHAVHYHHTASAEEKKSTVG